MKKYIINEAMHYQLSRMAELMNDGEVMVGLHELKPIEPLSEGAKRALVCNWFSEGWAQEQAMGLLADYDQAIERHILGGAE